MHAGSTTGSSPLMPVTVSARNAETWRVGVPGLRVPGVTTGHGDPTNTPASG